MERNREDSERRKEERKAALEARIERERQEAEAKKRKIFVDKALFIKICRFGYITDSTPLGMIQVQFNRNDILDMCSGALVEKEYHGIVYNFLLADMTRYEKIDVVKNSPLFWQLVESL